MPRPLKKWQLSLGKSSVSISLSGKLAGCDIVSYLLRSPVSLSSSLLRDLTIFYRSSTLVMVLELTESKMLSQWGHLRHLYVSQGKTKVDSIDDNEELEYTEDALLSWIWRTREMGLLQRYCWCSWLMVVTESRPRVVMTRLSVSKLDLTPPWQGCYFIRCWCCSADQGFTIANQESRWYWMGDQRSVLRHKLLVQ